MSLNLMVFILEIIYQKIKDRAYVINLDEHYDIGTHWIALQVINNTNNNNNNNNVTSFDSFGVEHISKEIKEFINNRNIIINIFRIQAYDSITCGHFFIGFINFMLAGLTDYTNLFSPNNFKGNDDIILNYFTSTTYV